MPCANKKYDTEINSNSKTLSSIHVINYIFSCSHIQDMIDSCTSYVSFRQYEKLSSRVGNCCQPTAHYVCLMNRHTLPPFILYCKKTRPLPPLNGFIQTTLVMAPSTSWSIILTHDPIPPKVNKSEL